MVLCFFQCADQLKSVLDLGAFDFRIVHCHGLEHQHNDCISAPRQWPRSVWPWPLLCTHRMVSDFSLLISSSSCESNLRRCTALPRPTIRAAGFVLLWARTSSAKRSNASCCCWRLFRRHKNQPHAPSSITVFITPTPVMLPALPVQLLAGR